MADLAQRAWATFRTWPLWAQALAWLLAFWALIPLLIWVSAMGLRWNVALGAFFSLALFGTLVACGDAEDRADTSVTSQETPGDEAETETPSGPAAEVTRVVDGDTIEVSLKGETVKVRLIGIDTPETVHQSKPVECFGQEASAFTKSNLEGKTVTLEFDVQRTDRYQRTLAYVWVGDRLFNEVLVRRGFAQVSTFPPNVAYQNRFLEAQREARRANAGLWGACPQKDDDESASGERCDPAYPDVCIPPPPPDLNCPDIPHRNFKVLPPDPHRFDGDGDGIGCES